MCLAAELCRPNSPSPQAAFPPDHKQALGLLSKMGIALGTTGNTPHTRRQEHSGTVKLMGPES